MCFMQDDTHPHPDLFPFLAEHFQHHMIAMPKVMFHGHTDMDGTWLCHSPDLNLCDFFVWGHVKGTVYLMRSKSASELKIAIL